MLTAHIPVPAPSLAAPLPVRSWRGYPGSLQVDDRRPRPQGFGAAPPPPPAAPSGTTPPSNTGLKCQNVSSRYNSEPDSGHVEGSGLAVKVDWLQGVIIGVSLPEIRQILAHIGGVVGDEFVIELGRQQHCGKQYASSAYSVATHCLAAWNYGGDLDPATGELRPGELLLSLTGDALGRTSGASIHRLAQWLREWGLRATRLDVALDDLDKALDLDLIRQACADGNHAGFKSFSSRRDTSSGQVVGDSCYMGSAGSDHRVTAYDKSLQTKGQIDSIRLESRLRDELADIVFAEYCEMDAAQLHTGGAAFLASIPLGKVNFVDRGSGDRLGRMRRLDWWGEFVARVGVAVRIGGPRIIPSLKRSCDWFLKQATPTLAVLNAVMPESEFWDWLSESIGEGAERFKERHFALVRTAQSEGWSPA